jgi:hypothetical protein
LLLILFHVVMFAANPLRNEMLDFFLKSPTRLSIQSSHQLVSALLNSETKTLSFERVGYGFWSDFNDRLEMMLQSISEHAPNLNTVAIWKNPKCGGEFSSELLNSPDIQPLNSITSFTGYGWQCSTTSFNQLITLLPNVVHLEVRRPFNIYNFYSNALFVGKFSMSKIFF